jgi:hypothetical protein
VLGARRGRDSTREQELRRREVWQDPERRWRFYGDVGAVTELLATRTLVQELGLGVGPLPEAFLAAPIATMIRAALGPVDWPARFDAPHTCVGPRGIVGLREGTTVVVCAARPGSIHADAGQTRTAGVWRSTDGGTSWEELGWELTWLQRLTPSGQWCWPPEQVEQVALVDGALVIEWEDPWIDWEAGHEWRATLDSNWRWRMQVRGSWW